MHSEIFTPVSFSKKADLVDYAKNIRVILDDCVRSCNEGHDREGFFEFKRSTLVTINVISDSQRDASSNTVNNVYNMGGCEAKSDLCCITSIKEGVLDDRSRIVTSIRVGMRVRSLLSSSSYSCSKFKTGLSESREVFTPFYNLTPIRFYHCNADMISLSKHNVDLDHLYSCMNSIDYRVDSVSVDNFVNMLKLYLQEKTRLSSGDVEKVCVAFSGLFKYIKLYNDCILIYNEHFNISALDEEVRERVIRQYREIINCLKFIGFNEPSLILHSLLSCGSKVD